MNFPTLKSFFADTHCTVELAYYVSRILIIKASDFQEVLGLENFNYHEAKFNLKSHFLASLCNNN